MSQDESIADSFEMLTTQAAFQDTNNSRAGKTDENLKAEDRGLKYSLQLQYNTIQHNTAIGAPLCTV